MNNLVVAKTITDRLRERGWYPTKPDSIISATGQFINDLRVNVSHTALKETLLSHPDYPSLLSISEALHRWHIKTMELKITPDKLDQLPLPFLAHIKIGARFLSVEKITKAEVICSDGQGNQPIYKRRDFLRQWDGVVLLAQAGERSGDPNYKEYIEKERWGALRLPLAFMILLLVGVGRVTSAISNDLVNVEYFVILLAGHLLGIFITALLLWYEYDEHNPLLQKVCSVGKKTNCQAILHSEAAKVIGSLTWGDMGFIYFTGGYLYLLSTGTSYLYPMFVLSLLTLPYVFFSIYYQARVANQWCVLCMSVQAVLLLEALSALLFTQTSIPLFSYFPAPSFIVLLISFIFPAFAWLFAKPYIYAAKKGAEYRYQLARFKNNGEIFEAMLQHQPTMNTDPGNLGLCIGNPKAPNVLTKVCNPYCGPCAKAHPKVEDLINKNPDWQVRIVFTATGEDKDRRTAPAAHLLAIAETSDEKTTWHALDNWYNAEEKDYKQFAVHYPMNGELKAQKEKLKAMAKWCKEAGITHTPTFFVNGHKLPRAYNDIADLKHIIMPA